MPKIKDLGINIVPGTMRPPEIGGGGGCGATRFLSDCNCISDWQRAGVAMNDTVPTCSCDCIPTVTPICSQCDCISNEMACKQYTRQLPSECNCVSNPTPGCLGASRGTFITPLTPKLAPGVLTRDDIAKLRAQLKQGLENLDVAEKNLLPKTLEEIDSREKELQSELDALKARRSELKK